MLTRHAEIMRRHGPLSSEDLFPCVVLTDAMDANHAVDALFDLCNAELAYFKTSGCIYFVDSRSQGCGKLQKRRPSPDGTDPHTSRRFDRRKRERHNSKIKGS
jgi:hypothetical protein